MPKYILLRGTAWLTDFPQMSAKMTTVARSQDLIPWTSLLSIAQHIDHGNQFISYLWAVYLCNVGSDCLA